MSNRLCKYGCNTMLGEFDAKENKYLEADGKTLHTRERCESLKQKTKQVPSTQNKEARMADAIDMIRDAIDLLESIK